MVKKIEQLVVRKRFGNEWTNVTDFIRPNDFMITQVLASRRNWSVIDLWKWVIDNIEYPSGNQSILDQHTLYAYHPRCLSIFCSIVSSFVPARTYSTVDYWSFPAETLRDRIGDCEDSTFVLTSLLRRAYPDLPVYATVGYFENYGHVWTAIREGNDWAILDSTLQKLPAVIPKESWDGPNHNYRPIFRFNEKEIIVESKELIVPEKVHIPGKDITVRSWYLIIESQGERQSAF